MTAMMCGFIPPQQLLKKHVYYKLGRLIYGVKTIKIYIDSIIRYKL